MIKWSPRRQKARGHCWSWGVYTNRLVVADSDSDWILALSQQAHQTGMKSKAPNHFSHTYT